MSDAEKNSYEVMLVVYDKVATTAAEISHITGLSIHAVIDSCKLLAERGEVVARMRADTMDYAVCLIKHPTTKVCEFLNQRHAAPLLEIAALTGLTKEQVEASVESLRQNRVVKVRGAGEDKIVLRTRQENGVPLVVWGIGFLAAGGLCVARGQWGFGAMLACFGLLSVAAWYWDF